MCKEPSAVGDDRKEDGTSSETGEASVSNGKAFPTAACGADYLSTSNRRKKHPDKEHKNKTVNGVAKKFPVALLAAVATL